MTSHTFLWHDYETFGISPRRDRPAQFAAIRTDAELNEIGEPMMVYCRPAPDYLPDPQSCLITGITPQLCLERGLSEHEFAVRIEAELSSTGTVGVGYNTIRFDDEFTRHLFWRNLIDPYAREWQNSCGRWDLLDVVRMTYALRPEGIVWPRHQDGKPSFKLEDLTRANGISHESAHDALSDVRATIAVARLIRQHQPKLFDFAFSLHKKDKVLSEMGLPATADGSRPFLHISGMFPADQGCLAVMWPLASHPGNRNEILAWDLAQDPSVLSRLSVQDIRQRLFTPRDELPAGVERLGLKSIHVNKSPMVVGQLKTLRPEMAQRWGLDWARTARNVELARALPDLSEVWKQVFEVEVPKTTPEPEQDLYGGFLEGADRRRLQKLKDLDPSDSAWRTTGFDDPRLSELVFCYRARNFPESLSPEEAERWKSHCVARLIHGQGGGLTAEAAIERIDVLAEAAAVRGDDRAEEILSALVDYVDAITPEV